MGKKTVFIVLLAVLTSAYFAFPYLKPIYQRLVGSSAELEEVRQRVGPSLRAALSDIGLQIGQPTYIRVFKEEQQLEVWLESNGTFELFKTYQICNFSGELGPKVKEGDGQSPEGFYNVNEAAMNPNSSYHLSFNLGFPNIFDQAHSRTGSFLMIHGNCVSVGCYAMTDEGIEEIYLIVEAAHTAGQKEVPVHAFPFKMTSERLERERGNIWFAYWQNLKDGFDWFERQKIPPSVRLNGQQYLFTDG